MKLSRPGAVAGVIALTVGAFAAGNWAGSREDTDTSFAATPTLPPTATPSTPSASPTTSAAPTSEEVPRSPRGHIVKGLGEVGGFTHPDDTTPTLDELVLSFTIDDIRVDAPCPSEYAQPPQNGHFLALDIRASTTETYPADQLVFAMNPADFSLVGPDGVTISNIATAPTYSCISYDDPSVFPSDMFVPASQYRGTVILDVPSTTGTLIYTPMGQPNGWEWSF